MSDVVNITLPTTVTDEILKRNKRIIRKRSKDDKN